MIIFNVFCEKIWKNLNVNYWINNRIRINLKIIEKTYKIIYVFLKKNLIKNKILNDKFNHVNIKKNCNRFLSHSKKNYNIQKRWFCIKKTCLFHWIQKINNNCKKKRTNLISLKKLCNNNFIINFHLFNVVFDAIIFFFRKKKYYNEMYRSKNKKFLKFFLKKSR